MYRNGGPALTGSDAKLSKLITEYKAENERCSAKISELKERLSGHKRKFKADSCYVNSSHGSPNTNERGSGRKDPYVRARRANEIVYFRQRV